MFTAWIPWRLAVGHLARVRAYRKIGVLIVMVTQLAPESCLEHPHTDGSTDVFCDRSISVGDALFTVRSTTGCIVFRAVECSCDVTRGSVGGALRGDAA